MVRSIVFVFGLVLLIWYRSYTNGLLCLNLFYLMEMHLWMLSDRKQDLVKARHILRDHVRQSNPFFGGTGNA